MSFADGFAQGYGMVNETMKAKREEEERKAAAERQDKQFQQTYGLQNATLNEVKSQHAAESKFKQTELDTKDANEDADRAIKDATQKAEAQYRNGILSVAQSNAASEQARANAAINASEEAAKNARYERDQAVKKQKIEEANQRLQNYFDDGKFIPPTNKQGLDQLHNDLLTAKSFNLYDVYDNPDKYHYAAQTLQDTLKNYQGGDITSKNNPQAIDAFNTIFKHHINNGVDGKEVLDKKVEGIFPINDGQGKPTGRFGIHLAVTKQGGAIEPAVMTTDRHPLKPDYSNIAAFSGDDIANEINGHTALIDELNSNPQIRSHISSLINQGKKLEKTNEWVNVKIPVYDQYGKKATDADGKEVTQEARFNPRTNQVVTAEQIAGMANQQETQSMFSRTNEKPGLNVLTNNKPSEEANTLQEEAHPYQDIWDAAKGYGKSVKDNLLGKDKQKMYMEQAQGIYNTYNQKTEPNLEIKRIMDSKKYNKEEKLKLLAELVPRQQKNQ